MEQSIKELALKLGADVCGIANVAAFDNSPKGFSPLDVFSECKSVVVIGLALPKGLFKISPRLVYNYYNYQSCPEVDRIALALAKSFETKYNCLAVPMPSDSPYEYWDEESKSGHGLISMKHAAVLAGIGTLGKNTLLLSPVFGNKLTLGAILTNLDLKSDPPAVASCIDGCHLCLDKCPVHAIENGIVNQKLCRENTYGKTSRGFGTVDCNKCRVVCPRG